MAGKKGFTLLELMAVVAVIGVLIAVAIPQYLDYLAISKRKVAVANFRTVLTSVRGEIAKKPLNAARAANFLEVLNDGGRNRNPYEPSQTACAQAGSCAIGQVGVSETDLTALSIGDTIQVTLTYIDESRAVRSLSETITVQ